MVKFADPHITTATEDDIPLIADLLNRAYRGESSRQGWTHESHLISGEVRTNTGDVKRVLSEKASVFLKYVDENDSLVGCVNLQHHGERLYLGMFSVSPQLQGGGVGKKMLEAAEEYANHLHCNAIYMTVISVRTELIDWYKRRGYKDTGQRELFAENEVSGKHLQPLEFMTLEKNL